LGRIRVSVQPFPSSTAAFVAANACCNKQLAAAGRPHFYPTDKFANTVVIKGSYLRAIGYSPMLRGSLFVGALHVLRHEK